MLRASCGGDGRGLGTELLGAGGTRALLTPQRRPFPSLGCLSPTEISTVDSYRQWEPIHLFLWFTQTRYVALRQSSAKIAAVCKPSSVFLPPCSIHMVSKNVAFSYLWYFQTNIYSDRTLVSRRKIYTRITFQVRQY